MPERLRQTPSWDIRIARKVGAAIGTGQFYAERLTPIFKRMNPLGATLDQVRAKPGFAHTAETSWGERVTEGFHPEEPEMARDYLARFAQETGVNPFSLHQVETGDKRTWILIDGDPQTEAKVFHERQIVNERLDFLDMRGK